MIYQPKVLDLFCGAGGMSLGFRLAGCEIVGGIDLEAWPVRTHHHNFPDSRLQLPPSDITKIDPSQLGLHPGDIDILVGGPPCQGFSHIGRGKIRSLGQERERDKKNRLYQDFIRFVDYFQPPVFVIENVAGMTTFKQSSFLDGILHDLEYGLKDGYSGGISYSIQFKILCAKDYGVPQVRNRLFIIGQRKDISGLSVGYPEAFKSAPLTLKDAISDLPRLKAPVLRTISATNLGSGGIAQTDAPRKYSASPQNAYQAKMRLKMSDVVSNHLCRGHNEQDLAIFKMLKQGQIYRDLPAEVKRYRQDIFNDKYRRLRYDQPSWTLTAHMQKDCLAYIHPTQCRSLSTREAARIQSFPDSFVFVGPLTKVFRMIGNAVPPFLAEAIAREIVPEISKLQQQAEMTSVRA